MSEGSKQGGAPGRHSLNRLSRETSPYLRQHETNPVEWYPWGEEALERARREDKPILLSIGYSACHWCHVMAHESFENPRIAAQMNADYINIKVDREERPDLDQIYQNVAQMMTRSGGWPLTVFLTPDLQPFFGGTYFPPEDRYGRPGFPRVLTALADAWRTDRAGVLENAGKMTEVIRELGELESRAPVADQAASGAPTPILLDQAAQQILGLVDYQFGGLGSAPKFPNPMVFTFLWRFSQTWPNGPRSRQAKAAVLSTLVRMGEGGIYDQIGGGFSRYSVDSTWSIPHFEKMLYDNGLLLKLMSEVLLSRDPLLAPDLIEFLVERVESTVEWMLREMRQDDGLFHAAQDADSEGEEGRFFVWTPGQLEEVLSPAETQAFKLRYGVSHGGNFEHGSTVLHIAVEVSEISNQLRRTEAEVRALLASARSKVFAARCRRVPPGTDTKALVSWNALAIQGLAWASQALQSRGANRWAAEARAAADRAYDALLDRAVQPVTSGNGLRLYSTVQQGQGRFDGYLDDYAFLAQAALDLARWDPDEGRVGSRLEKAHELARFALDHFALRSPDGVLNGFAFTSDEHETLITRPVSTTDQAIPAGSAVMIQVLLVLGEIGPSGATWRPDLDAWFGRFAGPAAGSPIAYAETLNAAWLWLLGPLVLSGPRSEELVGHSAVFRKPSSENENGKGGILLCHFQACLAPILELEIARSEIRTRLES